MKKIVMLFLMLSAAVAFGAGFSQTYDGYCVGPVKIDCAEAGGWSFSATRGVAADGVEEMEIVLSATKPLPPPRFSVSFDFAQIDAHHKWTTRLESVTLPPNWGCRTSSRLCSGMPLVAFLNDNDRNRATVSCSEAKRTLGIEAGIREEDCHLVWKISYFEESEAPLSSYRTKIRFDRRDVFFGDAIASGSQWISATAGLPPARVPEAAFEPLYSAWYSFHQNVYDKEIEGECVEAAKLGMKVLIVDDGWQTDDNNRGYAYCGDWEISKKRFPDMASHVAKVHALGMKYMIWYGVPMIGLKSKNYERFKGKYLWTQNSRWSGYSCLDPRFPEVRKFLCDIYAKAMKEWNLDGLKLDFIDAIGFRGADPAVKENYAGRDIRSLSEAVDQLMKDVYATLIDIKPDALVEFRQGYIGPGIRQYGNMMRAADCPGDMLANRCRIANLRLTSGKTAVHADMLEWNVKETPESAARYVLSTMFGVIQYSVMLRTLPADHKRMIAHWLEFSQKHRDALLKGAFRPRHFEAFYPIIEGESAKERIIGIYNDVTFADCGSPDRDVYLLNATGKPSLVVKLAAKPASVEVYDTFGTRVAQPVLGAGLQEISVPVSGYVKIVF